MAKRKTNTSKPNYSGRAFLALLACSIIFFTVYYFSSNQPTPKITTSFILQRTWNNYHVEIEELAEQFDLPPSYFLAVIVLECSGANQEEVIPRFERHVFRKLKDVRDKKRNSYGSISYRTIHDANDEALENLAKSWGPFQLMGYQCIEMGINVADIRGDRSLYWGMYWINQRYGKYLRKKDYKNAFHIHNAGHPHPLVGGPNTHDPSYVQRGIQYVEYFENKYSNE